MKWQILGKKVLWGTHYTTVKVLALIRHNATGEVAEYITEELLEDGFPYPSTFNWEENNYSCDCNRHIFFNRAKGIDAYEESTCTEGKYSVNLINPVSGEVYYKEW